MGNSCCIADRLCEAPANLIDTNVRSRCFRCGDFVCKACSIVMPYMGHKRKRLCNNCVVEVDGNELRVVRKAINDADYEEGTPAWEHEWDWATRHWDEVKGKYVSDPLPANYPRRKRIA